MKSKLSIILFGISFLIALLGEAYLLNMPQPNLFSIIGIGVVVILTGLLWFDSIWEHISSRIKEIKILWEESRWQDAKEWELKYTELINIQKATYTALKKSIIKTQNDLNKIIQSQNKIMDEITSLSQTYQDKADVNIINSNKEDTQQKKAEPDIIPLYDNPDTALTPDEIATLFDKYGK